MEDDDAENDDEELASMSTEQLRITTFALGNDIRVLTDELQRISWELLTLEEKTEKNQRKIKIRTKLPYIVATVVETYFGNGAQLLRDAFLLAKEKAPCIIFIDELDAIGSKRFGSEKSGDRQVQHTIFELLEQLDGFSGDDSIKVIAATNRDILDPALLRSGRLERKIEFPHPSEKARVQILHIHSRTMNVHPDVNFEELACLTDGFNGAQLKAVCVEAGMLALRRDSTDVLNF